MPVRSGCIPVKKALRPGRAALLGVVVGEHRAFLADLVDVGRLSDHQAAMVDARLHPADIIAHDEEDVWFLTAALVRCAGSNPIQNPLAARSTAQNRSAVYV